MAHVNLTAHVDEVWHVLAFECVRDFTNRSDIGRDVLALGAISACRCVDDFPAFVPDRDRQPVDLGLRRDGNGIEVAEL